MVINESCDPVQIYDICSWALYEKILVPIDLFLAKKFDVRASCISVKVIRGIQPRSGIFPMRHLLWRGVRNKLLDRWVLYGLLFDEISAVFTNFS